MPHKKHEQRADAVACDLAAGSVDDAALIAFAVTHVEQLLVTGDVGRAFDRAADARDAAIAGGFALPAAPVTRGRDRLAGNRDLQVIPFCYRRTISDVFDALGRFSRSDRRLLPWLFEGAKLWTAERESALAAVRNSAPHDEELGAGFTELVRFATTSHSRKSGDILRSALKAGKDDARWLALFLGVLDANATACRALAEKLLDVDDLAAGEDRWIAELRRYAAEATQPIVRALAFAAVGGSAATLATIVRAHLSRHGIELVVLRAIERRCFDAEVAAAAQAAIDHAKDEDSVRDLEALLWNCRQAAAAPTEGILPGTELSPPRQVGDALVAAYHRIRTAIPRSSWCNDEDEIGALVIAADPAAASQVVPIPMTFPAQRNGANLAKRRLRVEGVIAGELFVTIVAPFSDARGRGSESYLWSFRPPACWRAWARADDALRPMPGDAAEPVCYGELIIWREGDEVRFAIDNTSYHLDDWTESDTVIAANAARAREAEPPLPSGPDVTWADLSIPCPAGSPALTTVWTGHWAGRHVMLAHAKATWPELAICVVRAVSPARPG